MSDRLSELLAASREGSEHVEEGAFRLDWRKALDKVKRFQLTDPHRYALEIVGGAVAGGATSIDVHTDADDVVICYDGQRPSADDLANLFDFLFSQERELLPLKQLALGVNSALSLEPQFVRVDVGRGDDGGGHRLELTSHEDIAVGALPADAEVSGVRVHVRDRFSWKVVTNAFRRCAEARLVAEHCRRSRVPITLDGDDVVEPFHADAVQRRALDTDSCRGELVLPRAVGGGAGLAVYMNGVFVTRHEFDDGDWMRACGIAAWVDAPGLTRDASHADIHRDAHFARVVDQVRGAAETLLRDYARAILVEDAPRGTATRHYLAMAARVLLRARKGHHELPPELDALLDVPLVELPIETPEGDEPRSPLRPLWEIFTETGAIHVAERRYEVARDDLPEDVLPVLGPHWVAQAVFRGKTEPADELLARIEEGSRRRWERERRRRDPVLAADEALVKVAIADEARGIRGELGVCNDVRASVLALAFPREEDRPFDHPAHKTTFAALLRAGVPLGGAWVETDLACGVAILESDAFEPDPTWQRHENNAAARAVASVLQDAIPALLETIHDNFAGLPPSQELHDGGWWSVDESREHLPARITAMWPRDSLAAAMRPQVDRVLARRTLRRGDAPWLWAWPIFHRITGEPVSLDELSSGTWQAVTEWGWGGGEPEGVRIANLARRQAAIVRRYLGKGLPDGAAALRKRRSALAHEAEVARRRKLNIARAQPRRQGPRLRRRDYEAIADIALDDGAGQIGIPRLGTETSWIRFLDGDGLPIVDKNLDAPFPLHAVVACDRIEADEMFEDLADHRLRGQLVSRALGAVPALVAAFAATPAARDARGNDIIWCYLGGLRLKGTPDKRLASLPGELADQPLLPTVAHGRISLRELVADASAHGNRARAVAFTPGSQVSERPILVCGPERRKALHRLVGVHCNDYTRKLEVENEALARMRQPRRPAVIQESTALRVRVDGDTFKGELGLRDNVIRDPDESGWVEVLIDGVPLQRARIDARGMPVIGVVTGTELAADAAWQNVKRDRAWREVEDALEAAVDRLIVKACERAAGPLAGFETLAVTTALREVASRVFRDDPERLLEDAPAGSIDAALAHAPLWPVARIENERVSLAAIAEVWRATRTVHVTESRGHLAPGRIVVRGGDELAESLRQIFGHAVRDGTKVVARDDAAHRRRTAAPSLDTRIVSAIATVELDERWDDLQLRARGQVGLWSRYRGADDGVLVRLGVDGRLLCTRVVDAPVRGIAHVDCHGLRVNRDWTGPKDNRQTAALDRAVVAALWRSVAEAVHEGMMPAGDPESEDRRAVLVDALAALAEDTGSEPDRKDELYERLRRMPLFRTVARRRVSADGILTRAEADGRVLAVGDDLDEGTPRDGRFVLRLGSAGRRALHAIVGGERIERDDERWKAELEGLRHFQDLPETQPGLRGDVVVQRYFQGADTHGVVGLLMPADREGYGDDCDPPCHVGLHIGGRRIAVRDPGWHPAVEAWVGDERLTPTADFRDVVEDDVYREVVAAVEAELPELLARAARAVHADPTGVLRRRLVRYALDHRDALGAEPADAPGGRLLDARLWQTLSAGGPASSSTRELLDYHAAGTLAVAAARVPRTPAEGDTLVVMASDEERAILEASLGTLPDYGAQLRELAARRTFLERAEVRTIDLGSAGRHERTVWRHAVDTPGWEGEIGVPADPGSGIEIHVFLDHRPFVLVHLPSPMHAIAAVQWRELRATPTYDGLARGDAYDRFLDTVRREVWAAYAELAGALPRLDDGDATAARAVLLAVLGGVDDRAPDEPAFRHVVSELKRAPLLTDVTGALWSVESALAAAPGDGAIPAVSPAVARLGDGAGDRLVLVVDDPLWARAIRVVPLVRDEHRFTATAEGQKRRNSAPRSYDMPRGTIARTELDGPVFRGELALDVPPEDGGRLGVLSHGRLVGEVAFANLAGLVGWVDGALDTDRAFTSVAMTDEHRAELDRLYDDRLAAAADLAHDWSKRRRGKTWRAVCYYVHQLLTRRAPELGNGFEKRRQSALAPDDLPPRLRRALACRVFHSGDGEWIDLPAAIAGDDPQVIVATDDDDTDDLMPEATVIVGDEDALVPLFAAILGGRATWTVAQARAAARDRQKAAAEKARRAEEKRAARRERARARMLSSLQSYLRGALGSGSSPLRLVTIRGLRLEPFGARAPLVRFGEDFLVNGDHALWKDASTGVADELPDAIAHLAVAVLASLDRTGTPLEPQEVHELLTRVALRAVE